MWWALGLGIFAIILISSATATDYKDCFSDSYFRSCVRFFQSSPGSSSAADVWVNETGDTMSGLLTVNHNISANYFLGNGRYLTNLPASSEIDPKIAYITANKMCVGNSTGTGINCTANIVSGGASDLSGLMPKMNITKIVWFDEMWGDAADAQRTILGTEAVNTSTGNIDMMGVVQYTTAASNTGDGGISVGSVTTTNTANYNATKNAVLEVKMNVQRNVSTQLKASMGFLYTATTQMLNSSWTAAAIAFNMTSAGNWSAVTCNSGSCTINDTNVKVNTAAFQTLRIQTTAQTAAFYIDGTLRAFITGHTIPFNRSVAWIGPWIESGDATADILMVDYIYFERDR